MQVVHTSVLPKSPEALIRKRGFEVLDVSAAFPFRCPALFATSVAGLLIKVIFSQEGSSSDNASRSHDEDCTPIHVWRVNRNQNLNYKSVQRLGLRSNHDADLEYNLQHTTSFNKKKRIDEPKTHVCAVSHAARTSDGHSRLIGVKGKFYIGLWIKRRDLACRCGPRRILSAINMERVCALVITSADRSVNGRDRDG